MGDLAATLLSEEIRSLLYARRNGILVVSALDVTKGIFLRSGQIVFASSTLEADKLGEHLIRLGRISRAEFAAAYESSRGRGRIGQTLVERGLMTGEELGRVVAVQVQKIVMSLFTWLQGETVFQEANEAIPADLAVELSTHRLLLEGARIHPDASRLEAALGDPRRRLRVASWRPFDASRLPLTPAERQVLDEAARESRIGDVLAHAASRELTARALYALLVGGLVEDVGGGAREAGVVEEDTTTFRLAVSHGEAAAAAGRRETLLGQYEAMPRASHYEMLGVAPDAETATIDAAFHRMREQMEHDWRELKGDVQMSSVVTTLRLRRQEAHRVLTDPQLRQKYDRSLGGLKPERASEVTADAHARAGRLMQEALGLLERGERERAIPLLLEAVEQDPQEAGCRRLLAATLAQHRTLFRTAERHFVAALELEPADVELRYRFALYYKKAGLPKRAVAQLRHVLTANPDHEGARVELRSLEREDAV